MTCSASAWRRPALPSTWRTSPPSTGGYETVNGTHPNRAGMVTFADGWYQAMAGTVPTKG